MGYDATLVFKEDWSETLQQELDAPTYWKDIMKVEYTDTKTLHNPYLTDPSVQTGSRGTAYTMQPVVQTDESINITTFKILPQFVDRADLAQSGYVKQMEMAERQGILLNEAIETAIYADHASLTDFDNASIGGSAGNITVSPTNVDDIIRGLKREIREAGGESLAARYGIFIVWRPADFEILEAFQQANGFNSADRALENGTQQGIKYMGVTHYASNFLTSGHVIAGVKKVYHLGILKSTYGQIMVDDKDPGLVSGISVVSRVDFAVKAWTKTKPVLFDVTVA